MECYRCGREGHRRSECPADFSRPPAPPPASAPDKWRATPETPCQSARRRLAYFAQARQTRLAMGWGEGPVVRTAFRDVERMMPKTEGQLRQLAAAQVAESRRARLES